MNAFKSLRRHCAGAVLLVALSHAVPAHGAGHFHACELIDGSVRLFEHDVSQRFAGAVRSCVSAPAPTATALVALPEESAAALRVIQAPTDRRASKSTAPAAYSELIASTAQQHGIDARLLDALVRVESNYNAAAISPKGAVGLMQVMPATALRFGVGEDTLADPRVNLDVGTRYLRWLGETFDGRLDLQLAAYNAGEGAVMRHGMRIPPYRETQNYVRKILDLYEAR